MLPLNILLPMKGKPPTNKALPLGPVGIPVATIAPIEEGLESVESFPSLTPFTYSADSILVPLKVTTT